MEWIEPPAVAALSGTEQIDGTPQQVSGFWAWAMSDLRDNTVRGMLAEYLVAVALGADGRPRIGWDSCDVRTDSGLRVEVKTSAYVQAWAQSKPSRVVFGGLTARTWTPQTGYSAQRTHNADVYVFALLTAADHDSYNPLDTRSWAFWVLPAQALAERGARTIILSTLQKLAGEPLSYSHLADAIESVGRGQAVRRGDASG